MDDFCAAWYTRSMSAVPTNRNAFFRHLILCGALALCLSVLAGCITDAPGQSAASPSASEASVGPNALRDQSASGPSVPAGCTREWSAAAMDSVLDCPDIRPPNKPK